MAKEILALIIASLSILTTIVTAVVFFSRLQWNSNHHEANLKRHTEDLNKLGEKYNILSEKFHDEQRHILNRIEAVDKTMVRVSTTLEHMQITIEEIKEKII